MVKEKSEPAPPRGRRWTPKWVTNTAKFKAKYFGVSSPPIGSSGGGGSFKQSQKEQEERSNQSWNMECEKLHNVIKQMERMEIDILGISDAGLGNLSKRGQRSIEFCQLQNMVISNTWFKLPKRRIYMWTSPRHTEQEILRQVKKKIKAKVKDQKLNIRKLKEEAIKNTVKKDIRENIKKTIELNKQERGVNKKWKNIKSSLLTLAQDKLKNDKQTPKKEWMTDEILDLMKKRRQQKGHIRETKER
ncbi:hypothetical protein ILUMI_01749 [Ignelater luminosus]|uniref:Endonuclease-reverse transcriptase n=1 Tax=Ignelater luminosus TaxID=2038154 RepID=A0A8K0GLF3_IGNLU|nr:hypothetical protein ILUMI_01749 [Ignelater luminosus]